MPKRELQVIPLFRVRTKRERPSYAVYRVTVPQRVVREWGERFGEVPRLVRVWEEEGRLVIEPVPPGEKGVGSGG